MRPRRGSPAAEGAASHGVVTECTRGGQERRTWPKCRTLTKVLKSAKSNLFAGRKRRFVDGGVGGRRFRLRCRLCGGLICSDLPRTRLGASVQMADHPPPGHSKHFHEKAGPVKYCFWARVADEADPRPTGGGAIHFHSSLVEMFLAFPDFAHRRLALLPFALLNWSISAPVLLASLIYVTAGPLAPGGPAFARPSDRSSGCYG
jgi:hypothetical protein